MKSDVKKSKVLSRDLSTDCHSESLHFLELDLDIKLINVVNFLKKEKNIE